MDISKHKDALKKIGYGVSRDQVINSRGDVVGQCDPYGGFLCDVKEIMDIVCAPEKPAKKKEEPKYVRARDEEGLFISDDPETLDINEAWVKA